MEHDEADVAYAPEDYSLIIPDGWFKLDLNPLERDRGIVALVEQQFRGVDNAPHLKEQLMRDLQQMARDAYGVGGIELYLSTLALGPLPLASSLLVSMPTTHSWPKITTVTELASYLSDSRDEVDVVRLAVAGDAVREVRREVPVPEQQLGNTLPTTTVTYYLPIPATRRWLFLNFSTPLEPLAAQMVELFDVVASTLRWC